MRSTYARRSALVATLLILSAAGPSRAADVWTRVASGGLGNPARSSARAVALHDRWVWAAVGDLTGTGEQPRLFRASLVADTSWSEATPPWGSAFRGSVTDLETFGGDLWVATSVGQVWRYRRGAWSNATPRWTGTSPVHALGSWQLTATTQTLCAARGELEVACGVETGRTTTLPRPPLARATGIGGADLLAFRDRLFLSVSGTRAGSRSCEVHTFDRTWAPVTTDCFGDALRTWAGEMVRFGEHVYLGTGGHSTNAIYRVTAAGTFEDVTPRAYAGATVPRYTAAAVAGSSLFVGLHDGSLATAGHASVVRSANGRDWTISNEPGFGSDANFVTGALAGDATLLYATTFNSNEGFEVWRREFRLYETLRENQPIWRDWENTGRRLVVCFRVGPFPGCPGREVLPERFQRLKLGFDVARHPADDSKLILAVRQRFAQAEKELAAALELAGQADKLRLTDPLKARVVYAGAAQRLDLALALSREGWNAAAGLPGKS